MAEVLVGRRDYSLGGAERERAFERGLVEANWFQPEIEPAQLRELQARSNGPAGRDTVVWLALLAITGVAAFVLLPSWWAIVPLFVYGALYGGAADARWHEHGHGTAFASPKANEAIYHLACFMMWRGPTTWRWSHFRHHTDTIVVGRDAEILFERPSNVWRALFTFTHLDSGPRMLWRLVCNAFGSIDADALDVVPADEHRKIVWEARAFVAILLAVVAWAIAIGSIVPLLFVGLPTLYGAWLMVFFGITQHAGLREDVLDHRLNSRSVRMSPALRFLYLNMNYHVEHHIFPSVPYHALPNLHATIGDQLAPIKPSVAAAYREIFTALWRQQHDPSYEITVVLPEPRTPAVTSSPEPVAARLDSGLVDLGDTATLAPGSLRRIDLAPADDDSPPASYVLCRLDDGTLVLADGYCTHQQFHLADGAIIDGTIECPKHNARFDARTGNPVRRPARTPLTVYDVEEQTTRALTTFTPVASSTQDTTQEASPLDP